MSQALQFTLDLALIGHSFTVSSVFVERPYKLRFSLIELGHVIVIGDFWDQFAPQQFSIRMYSYLQSVHVYMVQLKKDWEFCCLFNVVQAVQVHKKCICGKYFSLLCTRTHSDITI